MNKPTGMLVAIACLLSASCEHSWHPPPVKNLADTLASTPVVWNRGAVAEVGTSNKSDSVKGDFNGDGMAEYMWLVGPEIDSSGMDCKGDCISTIKFSDPHIPSIKVKQCIGGTPVNQGDLNKNGTNEIGLSPDWFTSCWSIYYVWTYINDKWQYAVKPFSTHCNQWEENIKPVEIDPQHDGHVIIRYSESTDSSIELRTKSVMILR